MFNELDPDLSVAFAQARESLADEQFTAKLLLKIDRARRTRVLRQGIAVAAVAILVLLNIRMVLNTTANVVRWVGEGSPAYAEFLVTPWGWALSLLIGGWVMSRTRLLHR